MIAYLIASLRSLNPIRFDRRPVKYTTGEGSVLIGFITEEELQRFKNILGITTEGE
jgi:hypothetical protein